MSKKSYPEVAYTYIEYSSAIINSRAKKIIDKLEEKLSYKE
ncbi:hypothetical protein QU593_00275 [Rossellomorea marisflavi]|nr:hypothetical protein [Rossellomorea marisflavi]WJV18976.1 hypothetical protein QU593_00275 [Rossellomorea marisflavi]